MKWEEYIENLLSGETEYDSFLVSIDNGISYTVVPPMIKASITILDKMIKHQGRLNLLVLPEKTELFFMFVIMELLHSINQGTIKSTYDPTKFVIGEKLKVGNAVVEYLGIEEEGKSRRLLLKMADINKYSAPIEDFPYFQKTDTKRRLSKKATYIAAKKEALALARPGDKKRNKLDYIASLKTHLKKTIFYVSSLSGIKEQLNQGLINNRKIADILYFAYADYAGNITNISAGQMSGVPAITIASELYGCNSAISNGMPVNSIIIDISNSNNILSQLDALDELISKNVPIICITDVADSFDLDQFQARGFNIWRWDKNTITDKISESGSVYLNRITHNFVNQSIKYLVEDGKEISTAMKILAAHRKECEQQSSQMICVFEMLNRLTFSAMRAIVPFSGSDINRAKETLKESQRLLQAEASFISENTFEDYKSVINDLNTVYSFDYIFNKQVALEKFLKEYPEKNINVYLVIPEHESKDLVSEHWNSWCYHHRVPKRIIVMQPSEYYTNRSILNGITIIGGWLKRAIMRKIIFSFNTSQFVVLLYDYENHWKSYDSAKWSRALRQSSNKEIIKQALSEPNEDIIPAYLEEEPAEEYSESVDELGEIELILHRNKFKQYVHSDKSNSENTIPAIPVSFMGGYIAFYRYGHKVISATNIITSKDNKIEQKLASELKTGDFIVVREADKDIIRELADIALSNSGKSESRSIALKWKEALQIELVFCSIDELYSKLKTAGCNKGIATVKRWIEDEDAIAPQSKDDLKIIAKVTENETLNELLDDIYDAAQEVRSAHILAGRKISEILKMTLAEELKKIGNIDPFNFWNPLNIEIDGIGTIKVLKIIDIGEEVEVDPADTDRLIEE